MNGSQTENTLTTLPEPEAEPAPVMVEDLDQFVHMLSAWHEKQVATLQHFLSIPQGTAVQVGEDEADEVILIDDAHRAFIAGVTLALAHLGTLPFAAEVEEEDDDVPATTN